MAFGKNSCLNRTINFLDDVTSGMHKDEGAQFCHLDYKKTLFYDQKLQFWSAQASQANECRRGTPPVLRQCCNFPYAMVNQKLHLHPTGWF